MENGRHVVPMRQRWYLRPQILGVATVLVSCAVYLNSLAGEFVWDDVHLIVGNPAIKDIRHAWSFFSSELWRLVEKPGSTTYYYRPLFLLSFSIDYLLWGLNPVGYHLTNLVLHAGASLLVYQIGQRLFHHATPAFFSSMLFAVHPIHVESVAWIAGRVDLLAVAFLLLSFYLYILYAETGRTPLLFFALITYFLSLLSKEIGMTFPLVLIAYEASFKRSGESRETRFLGSYGAVIGGYVLLCVMYLSLRAAMVGKAIASVPSDAPPLLARIYTSLGIVLGYLRIMIWPVHLKVLYDIPVRSSLYDWQVALPAALICAIAVLALLSYRVDRTVFFCSLWFLIAIIPAFNLVPLRPTMMAERHMYLPSVGLCLLGGYLLYKTYQAIPHWSAYLTPLVMVLLLCVSLLTVRRNEIWKNEFVLFSQMTRDAPQNAFAHYNLGASYRAAGEMTHAILEWEKTVALAPSHSEAHNNLANVAMLEGRYAEAVHRYRLALQGDPGNAEAHYNLALALEKLGQRDEAVLNYVEFITKAPARYGPTIEEVKAHIQSLGVHPVPQR